ncbi:hypothetical protein ACSBR2_008113 [Camellia fascicularis]
MEELGSSNALPNQDMAKTSRDKEGDADMEDDLYHGLGIWNGVDTGFNPQSRSGVELAMEIGNNNIRSPTARKECRTMMDLGNYKVGSETVISHGLKEIQKSQIGSKDQISNIKEGGVEAGSVESSPSIQNSQNGPKDQISNRKEGGGAVGTDESSSSVSEAQELEPSSRPAQKKKGKKKVSFSAKHGCLHPKKGPLSLLRRYGHRGASTSKVMPKAAVWIAATAATSLSASVEIGSDKGRHILTEAQATSKMGEVLGVNYNGKEDEVLHQIVELELKDKQIIGRGETGEA